MRYFHGSYIPLEVGLIMKGRGEEYEKDWCETDFYLILEKYRPKEYLPHKQAVFMTNCVDDIDNAGGATEWVFEVKPVGQVSRHDLNWSSEISCLIGDGHPDDYPPIIQAANNYLSGKPRSNESLWEYLVKEVIIIRCEPFDTFK